MNPVSNFVLVCLLLTCVLGMFACDQDDGGGDSIDDIDDDDAADDDDDDDDDTVSNDFGLNWVVIPAGEFEMGCSPGDNDCDDSERPQHTVSLSSFEITATTITQTQYEELVGVNPSFLYGCPDCPVEQVTWFEADSFCRAVGGELPTEAQWEYAARGGTTTIAYCGNDAACLDSIAWHLGNSDGAPHPVASLQPNDFGLFDMFGNVWEWVNDWYGAEYYKSEPYRNPQGPDYSQFRSVRGAGAYNNDVEFLRASIRNRDMDKDMNRALGFRCAR